MKEYKRSLVFLGACLAIAVALGVANIVRFSGFELVCCMVIIGAICVAVGYICGGNKEDLFAPKEKAVGEKGEEKPISVEMPEKIAEDFIKALDKAQKE